MPAQWLGLGPIRYQSPSSWLLDVASCGPSPDPPLGELGCVVQERRLALMRWRKELLETPQAAACPTCCLFFREVSKAINWLTFLGDSNALCSSLVRTGGHSQGHNRGLLTKEVEEEV